MSEKYQIEEDVLSFIMDYINDGVYIFRSNGQIVFCNRAAQTESGYSIDEEEANILDIFPKLLCVRNHKITLLKASENEISVSETFAYRKNQTCYPVIASVVFKSPINDIYGMIVVQNITELRNIKRQNQALENQLSESDSMKNMFMANITHELRTPVNGMKGLADVLAETQLTPSQLENVNIIRKCCDNMTNLINAVLDYTKISAGKLKLEEEPFSFRQFMKNTIAVHMATLSQKGLLLQVNISEDVPEIIVGDELRLGQILNNLLSNAVKFTSIGKIAIEVVNTYEDKEHLEMFFVVRDTGIGIAREDMDKLFMSFSQVDGSITRKYGGTGLGLVITKKLIGLMQGSIYVESQPGQGSTFSFSARFKKKADAVITVQPEKKEVTEPEKKPALLAQDYPERKHETWGRKTMDEYLEKLTICLELELWEKAEAFAETIKQMLKETGGQGTNQAFRLLLAVRKEEYDKAVVELDKLRQMIY